MAWRELQTVARREFPTMRIERGTEVMLDTSAPTLSDPWVRMAGTRFALLEFPHMAFRRTACAPSTICG